MTAEDHTTTSPAEECPSCGLLMTTDEFRDYHDDHCDGLASAEDLLPAPSADEPLPSYIERVSDGVQPLIGAARVEGREVAAHSGQAASTRRAVMTGTGNTSEPAEGPGAEMDHSRAAFVRARLADNGYEVPESEIRLALANWEALIGPVGREPMLVGSIRKFGGTVHAVRPGGKKSGTTARSFLAEFDEAIRQAERRGYDRAMYEREGSGAPDRS